MPGEDLEWFCLLEGTLRPSRFTSISIRRRAFQRDHSPEELSHYSNAHHRYRIYYPFGLKGGYGGHRRPAPITTSKPMPEGKAARH